MLSDPFHAAQSCCGKCEACRQPCPIIEGSRQWQWCFLIEDLPLLCIQEQDVFYRPSIKALRPGRDLWLLIRKASGVARRRSGGSVGEVGEVTRARARQHRDTVYIWYAKKKENVIDWFFIRVIGFWLYCKCKVKGQRKQICFFVCCFFFFWSCGKRLSDCKWRDISFLP